MGWAGSPGNLVYLERISGPLKAVLTRHPHTRLLVFSGGRPRLPFPFEHHPYRPGAEPEFIRRLDIGLLPLAEEEHARGKSPIKALQYLACAIPVVGNAVGATTEILNTENSVRVRTQEEWIEGLGALIGNRERIRRMGLAGRRLVEARHGVDRCGELLLSTILGEEADGGRAMSRGPAEKPPGLGWR
jgi:glycosyltransferase involved in cell wall biosynthesis